jgi:hypothetical protein
LAVPGKRAGGHEPGQVACDVAVMIADGGQAIADMAVPGGAVWRLAGTDEQRWELHQLGEPTDKISGHWSDDYTDH